MSRRTARRMSATTGGTEMTDRHKTLAAAAGLGLLLLALGWLGWAVFRDFWVLVIACVQP